MKPDFHLQIENISIVPFQYEYISNEYLSWMNDKEVTEYTSHSAKEYEINDLITFFDTIDWHTKFFFAIFDTNKELHIGNCTLNNIDYTHLTFDIGVLIGNKNYWGNRHSEYVVALLMEFGFQTLGMRRFFGGCISKHNKTIFIMKKMQFSLAYIKKEAFILNDTVVNEIIFTIDKSSWENLRKKYKFKNSKYFSKINIGNSNENN